MKAWISGMPPFPWSSEWFLVRLNDGTEIELTKLPEEYSFNWKDREETYYKNSWVEKNVKEWKQKENSEYIDYSERPNK